MSAATFAASAADPDGARETAREILSDERFQPPPFPRPFQGILRRLGELLQPVGERIEAAVRWFGDRVPGGDAVVWVLLGAAIVAATLMVGVQLARRRARSRATRARAGLQKRHEDPNELDARADQAESRGDLEAAIRLRFRAGLLRLGSMGAVELRASTTPRQVAHTLRSKHFDRIADTFESVVYGRRRPRSDEVAENSAAWGSVLEEVRAG